ncbi:hypothetical protein EUGRSUZ_K00722 [Eucalyptus grandis]|uniref:Uncharacterized protein n=2 Tax=Eucalyptus grandis TaxID=71139 RepID=A0ACC3IRJ6_EUCGR|nr:hypothetical protein EUGRSUZ_K00722 [Eucalyptus grandis]
MPEDSPQQEYFHGIPIPIEVANKMPKDSAQQRYVGVYPIETNLYEEAVDHFYQEMSKEVETILRKPDP